MAWVSVEPSPRYAQLFRETRPHDILEQVAIASEKDLLTFYEIANTGLSTGSADLAKEYVDKGLAATPLLVKSITLDLLLEKYGWQEIHWLKIDVED
ncbi:FkbM family methyltransferase [Diaphorobacter aerolatus]|uniref:FkbM family methyltransferase n=1 Tax=Diaphorobacter aerolatus TaxID=1288495 RepID=UPI0021F76C17|nr:FkbM family methyltransferase [Diaphorobacter aerolatus]